MFSLINTYLSDREDLIDQYVSAWRSEEAFARHDVLTRKMHEYANTLKGFPHPVIKAKTFAFLCENAPIYINEKDWFGISLEVPKLDPLLPIGSYYHRPLMDLCEIWKKELAEQLTSEEDLKFVEQTRNHLFNEFYIDYNHSDRKSVV